MSRTGLKIGSIDEMHKVSYLSDLPGGIVMRFSTRLSLSALSLLTFVACGERVPPTVTMKSAHFAGSWIKADDLKANVEAADGGAATITVMTIFPNLEVTEEVRVAGQPAPDAITVGRMFVTMKANEATVSYNPGQLKGVKIGKRSDEEITRVTKAPFTFLLSINLNNATMTFKESVAGVEKSDVTQWIRLTEDQREKLKLNRIAKKPVTTPPPSPVPKPASQRPPLQPQKKF